MQAETCPNRRGGGVLAASAWNSRRVRICWGKTLSGGGLAEVTAPSSNTVLSCQYSVLRKSNPQNLSPQMNAGPAKPPGRSEERRVGKERRSRWSPEH